MGHGVSIEVISDEQSLAFPKCGVKLSYMRKLLCSFCEEEELIGLTTTEVCEKFVKPFTAPFQCSVCDWLQSTNHPAYSSNAQVFISHAWKYKSLDVVNALENHFRNDPDIVIWFDLFSNNQHKAVDHDFSWWCNTFRSAISQFGYTVMVLEPWNNPIPLTRAWCLFELWSTAEEGCRFEVAMSEVQQTRFLTDLQKDPDSVNKMLATVDVERSEAYNPTDKTQIFEAVKTTSGFAALNKTVLEKIKQWILHTGETHFKTIQAAHEDTDHPDALSALHDFAKLLYTQGNAAQALSLFEECLKKRITILGHTHPDTLTTMNSYATVLYSQGRYVEAVKVYEHCLEKRVEICGENHPDTVTTLNDLACVYYSQGNLQKALPMYEACLERNENVFGVNHPYTFATLNNLANVYLQQGELEKGCKLMEECHAKCSSVLGDMHPSTLLSTSALAGIYMMQGKLHKALPLYVQSVEKSKVLLGDEHPDVLTMVNNLASLYYSQGKYTEARPLYEVCLQKRRSLLGDTHPLTLATMSNLACLYDTEGNAERAVALYEQLLESKKVALGDDHPETIAVMNALQEAKLFLPTP
jgi:tetratricopeptide (TPR) repeat protein